MTEDWRGIVRMFARNSAAWIVVAAWAVATSTAGPSLAEDDQSEVDPRDAESPRTDTDPGISAEPARAATGPSSPRKEGPGLGTRGRMISTPDSPSLAQACPSDFHVAIAQSA